MEDRVKPSATPPNEDNPPCVVARAPCCGRVVFACVNRKPAMDRQAKREIADLAADGYTIETRTASEVRELPFGCHCKKAAA